MKAKKKVYVLRNTKTGRFYTGSYMTPSLRLACLYPTKKSARGSMVLKRERIVPVTMELHIEED
jgi:hypothetical protein